MSEIEIIADGSCLGNPGPGGWACILQCGQHERVLQGGMADTTKQSDGTDRCHRGTAGFEACQLGHHTDGFRVCASRHHRVPAEVEGQRLANFHR